MDLQAVKRSRSLIMGGIFLLLTGGAGAYYAGTAEEPPLVLQQETVAKTEQTATEIAGLEQANEGKDVRNPFSLLHERENEVAAVPDTQKPAGNELRLQENGNKGEQKNVLVKKEKAPEIRLCGIVEGVGGRLALLQVGSGTSTAAVGETVQGWQVTRVGRNSVTVSRSGQVLDLPLTMDNIGATGR